MRFQRLVPKLTKWRESFIESLLKLRVKIMLYEDSDKRGKFISIAEHDLYGVTYASFSDYNPAGGAGMTGYGNGVVTWRDYQPSTLNLKEIMTIPPNPDDYDWICEYLNKSYGFTQANDVKSVSSRAYSTGSRSYAYTYDGLHRLTGEAGSTMAPRLPQDSLLRYSAANPHLLESIVTGNTEYLFTYDKNGNMTEGWEATTNPAQRAITWNADNMPSSITYGGQTTTFLYDASGTRVKKTGPLGTTFYIGKHFDIVNGVKTKHIFAGGMRIAHIYTDPSGRLKIGKFFKRAVGSSVSTVMDDWLGVEQYSFAYYNGFGGEGSFDFRNNGVEMSGGVGYGFGASGSVSTSSFDVSGGNCTSASVGYDTRNGAYVSASYYGASARYYLSSGYYSVGYGMSFGVVGVNAGYYSNGGGSGWRLGGNIGQVGATYDYGTGSWRYSYTVDVDDLRESYGRGVSSRKYNGYGAEGGGGVFKIIDLPPK
ncbi:MAG: hypothetical protein HZB87_10985, partial [Desulfatitalea sp.]|nr:hypothetical protein [Desulfatitalea sp.]